jgi:hypothetical protein
MKNVSKTFRCLIAVLSLLFSSHALACNYKYFEKIQSEHRITLIMPDREMYDRAYTLASAIQAADRRLFQLRQQGTTDLASLQRQALPEFEALAQTWSRRTADVVADLVKKVSELPLDADLWRLVRSGEVLGKVRYCLAFTAVTLDRRDQDRFEDLTVPAFGLLEAAMTRAIVARKALFDAWLERLAVGDVRYIDQLRWAISEASFFYTGLKEINFSTPFSTLVQKQKEVARREWEAARLAERGTTRPAPTDPSSKSTSSEPDIVGAIVAGFAVYAAAQLVSKDWSSEKETNATQANNDQNQRRLDLEATEPAKGNLPEPPFTLSSENADLERSDRLSLCLATLTVVGINNSQDLHFLSAEYGTDQKMLAIALIRQSMLDGNLTSKAHQDRTESLNQAWWGWLDKKSKAEREQDLRKCIAIYSEIVDPNKKSTQAPKVSDAKLAYSYFSCGWNLGTAEELSPQQLANLLSKYFTPTKERREQLGGLFMKKAFSALGVSEGRRKEWENIYLSQVRFHAINQRHESRLQNVDQCLKHLNILVEK